MSEPHFSAAQNAAITSPPGPVRIVAGPGSGKTLVLTHRIRYLIREQHVDPSNILVITFTKAAANEMKERFLRLMGKASVSVTFGTFHSVFFGMLRHAYHLTGANVLSEEDRRKLLSDIVRKLNLAAAEEKDFLTDLLAEISLVKGELIDPAHYYAKSCPEEDFRRAYHAYDEALRNLGKIDYDDMLVMTYELFSERKDILSGWQNRYTHILVDEFQDINMVQYKITRMLASPKNNLFIVGDDDQSIYRFRGAKPEIMQQFLTDFPGARQITMGENFRCATRVVQASDLIIRGNKVRIPKELIPTREENGRVTVIPCKDSAEEYEKITERIREYLDAGMEPGEIAVLFRTSLGQQQLITRLMRGGIPFRVGSELPNLFDAWVVQDVLAYMAAGAGDRDRKTILRILNRPNRFLSRSLLEKETVSFEELKATFSDKPWMQERIDEMVSSLMVLNRMTPFAAVNYIRKGIGYDDFLKEYAAYRNQDPTETYAVLDEFQEAIAGIRSYKELLDYMAEYKDTLKQKSGPAADRSAGIALRTMHSSKGLEYKVVLLPDLNEGNMPHSKAKTEAELEEERRLMYVAMTRAKDRLHMYYVKERYTKVSPQSRYLEDLLEAGRKQKTSSRSEN